MACKCMDRIYLLYEQICVVLRYFRLPQSYAARSIIGEISFLQVNIDIVILEPYHYGVQRRRIRVMKGIYMIEEDLYTIITDMKDGGRRYNRRPTIRFAHKRIGGVD